MAYPYAKIFQKIKMFKKLCTKFYTERTYIRMGDIFCRPSLDFVVSPVQFLGLKFVARLVSPGIPHCFPVKNTKNLLTQRSIVRPYIRPCSFNKIIILGSSKNYQNLIFLNLDVFFNLDFSILRF